MKNGVLARTYATCGTRGGTVGCGSARMSPREINPPRLMDRDTRIPPSMEGLPPMTLSRPRPCPPHASNVASIPLPGLLAQRPNDSALALVSSRVVCSFVWLFVWLLVRLLAP